MTPIIEIEHLSAGYENKQVLNNVKHIACVNHHLPYHATADMPREKLEEHFLKV